MSSHWALRNMLTDYEEPEEPKQAHCAKCGRFLTNRVNYRDKVQIPINWHFEFDEQGEITNYVETAWEAVERVGLRCRCGEVLIL